MQTTDPLALRSKITWAIRNHFYNDDFIEVETPSLVLSPGMEPHIRPIKIGDYSSFLHTSPEFAMKRILASGQSKIFQICKAYRAEPKSSTHHPEFTILEWYRTRSNYEKIMVDVEDLFLDISTELFNCQHFTTEAYGPQRLHKPWPRFTVEEAFRKFAGLELRKLLDYPSMVRACIEKGYCREDAPKLWDDLFFLIMMNDVEPGLAKLGSPAIIYRYPESQAALSNLETDPDGTKWARRFEVYAGGLELANAFDELTDSKIQRARFEKDMRLRQDFYKGSFPPSPMDDEFLLALGKLPPTGGIALGIDRLAMYFLGCRDIREVLWQESYWTK